MPVLEYGPVKVELDDEGFLVNTDTWIPESFTVSPDSRHVAYAAQNDGKVVWIIDGVEGVQYDLFGTRLTFSPDSAHTYYVAGKGSQMCAVMDGQELGCYAGAGTAYFSPDSAHFVYAIQDEQGRSGLITMQFLITLRQAAELEDGLGDPTRAILYRRQADKA